MKYIIANWKMNMDSETIKRWFEVFNSKFTEIPDKTILIAPSELYLEETKTYIKYPSVKLCSQDVDVYDKGAHTGSTGAFQLKEFCTYSIVGHSERREPRELVLEKRDKCLKEGITPIVCFINSEDSSSTCKENTLIAWEDPQNISLNGVYRAKDPDEISKSLQAIKKYIPVEAMLIYGGSVNRDNIQALAQMPELCGYLVGNASLDPDHFLDIIYHA